MTELEQLRTELATVTESAEQWRQQVLVQDRQIARLTKTKERHKLRIERDAQERAQLQAEIDRLRRVHAQVAELLGLSGAPIDHPIAEQNGPGAGGSNAEPAVMDCAHTPEEERRHQGGSSAPGSLCSLD